jgi:anti-sigma factor RsiW
MNCSRELIEGYLDRELDLMLSSEVERHLADCHVCSGIYSELDKQRQAIRSLAPHYPAPQQLRLSIREALKNAPADRIAPSPVREWRRGAIAASVLLAASVAWNLTLLRSRRADQDALPQNLIASHVRSLIGTHLLDVASTDQHTVKPWFNGKIDFSPQVKDLGNRGFPLIGGRIEFAANRRVAALVYRRRQHVINLFTWPLSSTDTGKSRFAQDGFNVVHWSDGMMTYWAISDLDAADLLEFMDLYRK